MFFFIEIQDRREIYTKKEEKRDKHLFIYLLGCIATEKKTEHGTL